MLLSSVRDIHLNGVRKSKTFVKDVEELKWTGVCDNDVDDEKPLWIYLCVSICLKSCFVANEGKWIVVM